MKKNFKNNRAYGMGFNDGYQKGINDCEKELINVKNQLYDERIINQKLQLDNEKVKEESERISEQSERIGRELSEQSERIDELEVTVDNVLDVLNGLETEYNDNSSKMKDIMVKRDSMESENQEIDIVLNDYVDFSAINSDFVKEQIMALTDRKKSNSAEIKACSRTFSKLQKKNVGINSTINNFKVKNFDKIIDAVNHLTA